MKVTDDSRPPNGFTIAAPQLFDGTAMRGPALVTISCGLIESVSFGEAPSRGAVKHQAMLEELLAAEELVIGVLQPALAQHLIGEVVGVLEDSKPRHQSRRQRWPAGLVLIDRAELLLQE
jgi:hypothetical protein